MKRLGYLLGLLLFSVSCYAQTSAISATIVDLDGTTWANGKWKIEFVPNPAQPNINVYNINGTSLSPSVINQSGVMDGSGNLAVTIYQNQVISPAGSSWNITVCPNAVTACGNYKFTANSSTLNLSSILTPIIPVPRFKPTAGTYGYNDGEAILSLLPGSTYWNVTAATQRCYTGINWGLCNNSVSGVSAIVPATNITCTPLLSGSCTGTVSISASGGIASLTTIGTSGASAYSGGVLNIPQYQGAVSLTTTGVRGAATFSGNILNIPQYQCALTLTTTGTSGPATITGSGCVLNIPQYAGGGGNLVTTVLRTNPYQISGSLQEYDEIHCGTTPVDIRCFGAVIDHTTPIDSALQTAINTSDSTNGGPVAILLSCQAADSTGPGCLLQNSSILTGPSAGAVKFLLEGGLQLGSTLVGYGWENWFGIGGNGPGQFQLGTVPATIFGPQCYGTLGTAVPANTATTITPTFAGSGCTVVNLPVQSAITIAGTASSSATASRCCGAQYGQGEVTLTLASTTPRVPPGALVMVTGCADSSFDTTSPGVLIDASDQTKQTITYFQADETTATTTECTVTGLNEDAFNSARILCSNGTSGTFNGHTYTCGTGQITIITQGAHSSSDQWGEVAVSPSYNTYGAQTWSDLSIGYNQGMGFWAEGSTNLTVNHVSVGASSAIYSGSVELTGTYASYFNYDFFQANDAPTCGPSGGCTPVSYPYALRCDSDPSNIGGYAPTSNACNVVEFANSTVYGGVKLDGSGAYSIQGFPRFDSLIAEEVFGPVFTIDNRFTVNASSPLRLKDIFIQDNLGKFNQPLVAFTDGNLPAPGPTGTVVVQGGNFNNVLTNQYFNGNISVDNTVYAYRVQSPNLTSSSGVYNEGNLLAGEIENKGADFGPQIVPYGSLPMTSYTVPALSTLCAATGGACVATATVGPDGPNGNMFAVDLANTTVGGGNIGIASTTQNLYPGDHFIAWSWVRPGQNRSMTGSDRQGNAAFWLNLYPSATWAPTLGSPNSQICTPAAFGTGLQNNGWGPEVAICTVATADGSSQSIGYTITVGSPQSGGSLVQSNQFAGMGFTFIPGPNNPACTAAGTCGLSTDQLEEARRDQYHGFVPPNIPAGTSATGEKVTVGQLNQNVSNTYAGTCSIAATASSCTFTTTTTFNNTPICIASVQSTSFTAANMIGCTLSGNTVTVTTYLPLNGDVATTVGALLIGNPN